MIPHYFKPPKDFEMSLWLSQILQGYGIKLGAEYWRQHMVESSGCVFWQYNDCWPVVSWSSVDYFGRWKALQYLSRRFYSPLLVSGLEDAKQNSVVIFVSSDRLQACRGMVSWTVTDPEGKSLLHGSEAIEISPRQSHFVRTLELQELATAHGVENLLVWLRLDVDGKTESENLVTLAFPKDLKLANPKLKADVAAANDCFVVTLKAEKPALWSWLTLDNMDARYSDNFIHVTPDKPIEIKVKPEKKLSKEEFIKALRVHSLFDTYS
jgi:beta-mannosidase